MRYKSIQIETTDKENHFLAGYFEALRFTETGDLDQPESCEAFDPEFKRESVIDCLAFYAQIACYLSDDQIYDAGRDFWFTRQGHGVGFWEADRWPKHGEMFDKRAKAFGEVYPVWENYCPPV